MGARDITRHFDQGFNRVDEKTIRIAYLLYACLLLQRMLERKGWGVKVLGSKTASDFEEIPVEELGRLTDQILTMHTCLRGVAKDYNAFAEKILEIGG